MSLGSSNSSQQFRSFYDDNQDKHLSDVVITEPFCMAAERLGGADFDGDMVKTIANPILNKCVNRNYRYAPIYCSDEESNPEREYTPDIFSEIRMLLIPTEEPRLRDADDWQAKYDTVKDTFSTRVGMLSNVAFRRSLIAYNENSDAEERTKIEEEIELLAILTGLEIDSAKSGIKPTSASTFPAVRGKAEKASS